jgi:hypothetical protein
MVSTDSRQILVTHRLCPSRDQFPELHFIACCLASLRRARHRSPPFISSRAGIQLMRSVGEGATLCNMLICQQNGARLLIVPLSRQLLGRQVTMEKPTAPRRRISTCYCMPSARPDRYILVPACGKQPLKRMSSRIRRKRSGWGRAATFLGQHVVITEKASAFPGRRQALSGSTLKSAAIPPESPAMPPTTGRLRQPCCSGTIQSAETRRLFPPQAAR